MTLERFTITAEITPVAKPRMTRSDKWKQRPIVQKYWQYKDELQLAARNLPRTGIILMEFHLPMPQSWSKRKQAAMLGKPHQSRPDTDNLAKGVFDALYSEDSTIHTMKASKRWATTGSIRITMVKGAE